MASRYTRLGDQKTSFSAMMGRFGVVTVMNAKIIAHEDIEDQVAQWSTKTAPQIIKELQAATPRCVLETLKIANVTEDGPTKTVTGGQYNNTLIKFGKTATIEIQDALGNAEALEALCGGVVEYSEQTAVTDNDANAIKSSRIALHFTQDFSGPVAILGDSFFIDSLTGEQVPVLIVFYNVSPDSLFNLTQDAEGDATVFDMNGTLNTQTITVGDRDGYNPDTGTGADETHRTVGVFYSIISKDDADLATEEETATYTLTCVDNVVTFDAQESGYTAKFDGADGTTATLTAADNVAIVDVYDNQDPAQRVETKIFRYVKKN